VKIVDAKVIVCCPGRNFVTLKIVTEDRIYPISYPVEPLSDLAITLKVDSPPAEQTGHPGSRATSYVAHGQPASAPGLPNATPIDHWYYISGVDVLAPSHSFSVVIIGDSITDGRGSTVNGNNRWPDILARRLQAFKATKKIAVLNHGIGGNRVVHLTEVK
jgi:hypothetical protein